MKSKSQTVVVNLALYNAAISTYRFIYLGNILSRDPLLDGLLSLNFIAFVNIAILFENKWLRLELNLLKIIIFPLLRKQFQKINIILENVEAIVKERIISTTL